MGGSRAGGLQTKEIVLAKYGQDYYRYIGQLGGRKGRTGGFYKNRELAREAGALGGRKSQRSGIKNGRTSKQQREFERVHKHLIKIGEKARRRRERGHRLQAG